MVVFVVLGVLRVVVILLQLQRVHAIEEAGVELRRDDLVRHSGKVRGQGIQHIGEESAVAVRVAALELIAELQVGALEDWLRVGQADTVVPVVGRVGVLLVVEGQVGRFLVVVNEAAVVAVTVAVGDVSAEVQSDVAAGLGQTSVDLQPSIDVVALAVAIVAAVIGVHADGVRISKAVVLCQGIHHPGCIGVVVEGDAAAVALVVALAVGEIRTELDIRHRVRLPLQAEVGVDVRAAAVALAHAVDELRSRGGDEGLGVCAGEVVRGGVVVADVTAQFKITGLVLSLAVHPGEVATSHLAGGQTATAPAAKATPALASGVVGVAEHGHTPRVHEARQAKVAGVAAMGAYSAVEVQAPSLAHPLADGEVEHGLLLAVVDTRDTGVVALAVVGLDLTDHAGFQVLQGCLGVAAEELFLVDQDLLDLLTIDLNGTFLGDLGTGELLQQSLEVGACGHTEGVGVIDEGVGLHFHLRGLGGDHGVLQQPGIVLQHNLSQQHTAVLLRQVQRAPRGLVAYIRNTQQVVADLETADAESAVFFGGLTGHLGAVEFHNDHGGTGQGLSVAVHDGAGDGCFLGAGGHGEA